MVYSATLTKTGQITVPKNVREWLGVKPGQRIVFRRENNETVISREKTVDEITEKIRTLIPEDARRAYKKEYGGLTTAEWEEKWAKSPEAKEYLKEELRGRQ